MEVKNVLHVSCWLGVVVRRKKVMVLKKEMMSEADNWESG